MEQSKAVEFPLVTLRPFVLADSDALMTWASDARVTLFQRRHPLTAIDDARRYIANHILPHPFYRAICLGASGRPVGSISVQRSNEPHRASVGYRVAQDFWGRGIATAALRAVTPAVFEAWPELERLEAVADVENPASQRVLEKAGFHREGVLRKYVMLKGESRDMVMYSFLASDLSKLCSDARVNHAPGTL
ncbi:uncharacterized N-acetyltransferase p20-like [Zingiber officinale]|uniref:N-acetyltransferase domain-containing protein n=1 Tax=Zingiber officinale TaxID=94328 RepID=A0A8J5FCY8_ZINOF|nr:uncharacterized N-acetyltransferase p20-like [Zingiber officinale]KAG6484782.1 hypothetical protein ZIOFF_053307 [Zingiber officinale]